MNVRAPKNGGGTGRGLAKITQQAAPCRCGRTYGMPNSSAGGKAMRRTRQDTGQEEGRATGKATGTGQGERQGRDEWEGGRSAPRCMWVRLAGWVGGCVGCIWGLPTDTSAAGLRRVHASQRAQNRANYLLPSSDHCTRAGSRGPARHGAQPAAQFRGGGGLSGHAAPQSGAAASAWKAGSWAGWGLLLAGQASLSTSQRGGADQLAIVVVVHAINLARPGVESGGWRGDEWRVRGQGWQQWCVSHYGSSKQPAWQAALCFHSVNHPKPPPNRSPARTHLRRRPPGVRGERGEAGSEGSVLGRAAAKGRADSGVGGARGDSGGPAAAGAEPMGTSSEERGVEAASASGAAKGAGQAGLVRRAAGARVRSSGSCRPNFPQRQLALQAQRLCAVHKPRWQLPQRLAGPQQGRWRAGSWAQLHVQHWRHRCRSRPAHLHRRWQTAAAPGCGPWRGAGSAAPPTWPGR
jgi:hypothetical protein